MSLVVSSITTTTYIYTLSLHDALPILVGNLANGITWVVDQVEKDSPMTGEKGPLLVHTPTLWSRLIIQCSKPRPLGVVRDERLCLTKVLGPKHRIIAWTGMASVQIEAERAVIASYISRNMLNMAMGCDGKSAPLGGCDRSIPKI